MAQCKCSATIKIGEEEVVVTFSQDYWTERTDLGGIIGGEDGDIYDIELEEFLPEYVKGKPLEKVLEMTEDELRTFLWKNYSEEIEEAKENGES